MITEKSIRVTSTRRTLPAHGWLALVLLGLCLALPLRAGEQGAPVPRAWPGADVNAFVLPYTRAGSAEDELSQTAMELTRLATDKVFFDMLKYRSVGITSLAEDSMWSLMRQLKARENSPRIDEFVMQELLGQGNERERVVRPQHGVALTWGIVYEEGDDVYVQSYLRFLRRDVTDDVTLTLAAGDEPVRVAGRLPHDAVVFAPRRLSKRSLPEIRRAFERGSRIHRNADSSSGTVDRPEGNFSFSVTDRRGGWMKIASDNDNVLGWINADAQLNGEPLEETMPELTFINAAVGYLHCQMALNGTGNSENLEQKLGWTRAALDRYESLVRDQPNPSSPSAAAMTKALRGTLLIVAARGDPTERAIGAALEQFRQAAEIVPHSADLLNLCAMSEAYLASKGDLERGSPAQAVARMLDALALSPANQTILSNLENLYRYMELLPDGAGGLEPGEIKEKLDAVRRVRASLK